MRLRKSQLSRTLVATLPCQSGNNGALHQLPGEPIVATLPCQSGNHTVATAMLLQRSSCNFTMPKRKLYSSEIACNDSRLQLYHAKAETCLRLRLRARCRLVATLPCQSGNSLLSGIAETSKVCCNFTMPKRKPAIRRTRRLGTCGLQLYHAKAETDAPLAENASTR